MTPSSLQEKYTKLVNLLKILTTQHQFCRLTSLLEIRFNKVFLGGKVEHAATFDEFVSATRQYPWNTFLNSESLQQIQSSIKHLEQRLPKRGKTWIPNFYNADPSLAALCYAFTRYLKPDLAVETGVGFGITSHFILKGLEHNHRGHLISIDLPPLSDPNGQLTGLAIPPSLQKRWTLHIGTSREWLPKIVTNQEKQPITLFVSDSANVFTLQRWELQQVWPCVPIGGVTLFNNISQKFQQYMLSIDSATPFFVRQIKKAESVTGILIKCRR